jgi:hypothetical protein
MSRSTPKAATRVEQLIALATDPEATEEEARTAALAACRGIRKDGLRVAAASAPNAYPAPSYYSHDPYGPRQRAPAGAPRLPGGRELPRARERERVDRTLEATFLANTSGYEIGGEDEGPSKQPDFAFGFGVPRGVPR